MAHDYHEGMSGYTPDQLLVDGCQECEERSKSFDHGIMHLDRTSFLRAVGRSQQLATTGLPGMSHAEMPMLQVIGSVVTQLRIVGLIDF